MQDKTNLTSAAHIKAAEVRDDAFEAVQADAKARAAHARDQAAEEIEHFADAADAAAGQLPYGSVQAQAAEQVAAQIEGFAQKLRTADISAVGRDVASFARENPVVFLGAAALAGFAATRFLKARGPKEIPATLTDDPWGTQAGGPYHGTS